MAFLSFYRLLSALSFLSFFDLTSCQHVYLQIPWVESAVHSVTSQYPFQVDSHFVHYHGPTGTAASHPRPTSLGGHHPPIPTHKPGANSCSYWLEDVKHQGIAAFNPSGSSYQVFRNVKDFGARGDGVTDDTAAINLAISSGDRCAPGSCSSTTTSPALVYFPAGTYVISSSIIDYYYTQLIGNPNCMPTLQATANFTGFGLVDGDPYGANGLSFGSTNIFWRQIRNFVLDMTNIPASSAATGIQWPTAQATSLQNIVFNMSDAAGTQHQGIFIESGSGGFMNDLVFYGGLYGAQFGNQQFTMRNLTFYNAVTAINQLWDWGWTYKNISINNCSIGLNMSSLNAGAQSVGSVTFFDSSITNTPIGILTAHNTTSQPPTGGSLILENVVLNNVPTAVQGPNGVAALAGTTGSTAIAAWGEGHAYTPRGPVIFEGPIPPNSRPGSLTVGNKYYERSKPQYATTPVNQFLSTRSAGAKGDGVTDDTAALQRVILEAAITSHIVFFDAGTYRVTSTIYIPPNSKLVGESFSVIMGSGAYFSNMKQPHPIVQIGKPGQAGYVEWSDMIVSTQGATAGAILIEYNLASPGTPSGMWDVHARIGGFAGSNLQVTQCPTTPDTATPPAPVNAACIAAFMTMHITSSASRLYMENNWLWTADHDVEDPALTQITVYNGRGLYVESGAGTIWLVGTAVEHHTLYQYQFASTRDIFMGQIQTEMPYYQPNPPAPIPFAPITSLNDPIFPASCSHTLGFNFTLGGNVTNNCDAWGLRILDSSNLLVYGAGLYSFFDNYNTTCSDQGNGEACQSRIFSVEGSKSIDIYNLNTVGVTDMISDDGVDVAIFSDNLDGFVDTVALFRT